MKRIIAVLCLAVLVLSGCGNSEPLPPVQPTSTPQVNGENNPQPGENLPKAPPLPGAVAVMVDNYRQARPQIGLDKADLVYEMMAEGGITRFMALLYSEGAEKIGPVRSARYYFVQLARGYDVPLAHAGGSTDSLKMIADLKIKDLDEIYNSGGYFWRDPGRKMPHNLYSSTDRLLEGAKAKGYALVPLPQFPTADGWEGETHPAGKALILDYSTKDYSYLVSWLYNGQKYERKINQQPHLMEDGAAIEADNIIILKAQTKTVVKDNIPLSEIKITGEGETRYYIEGKVMKGTWKKEKAQTAIGFYDSTGQPMRLKEGKTWVQVIPDWSDLTYEE